MDIIATELHAVNADTAYDRRAFNNEIRLVQSTNARNLNVETVTMSPLLPVDRKWAIRFNVDRTVTIVLGMRDYGRGWFSAYFVGLVAARLGIPFRRIRLYYSATLPAILQTPQPFRILLHGSTPGPVARAAADVIEEMCDRVIEKSRLVFALLAGVGAADIGFDRPTGRFYVLDRDRSGSILEIAASAQGGSSASAEFVKKIQRGDKSAIA